MAVESVTKHSIPTPISSERTGGFSRAWKMEWNLNEQAQ